MRRPAAGGVLPPDNYLGPSAGKQTVYETVKKLNYDLFRAEERSKHAQAVKDDMARKHRIYEENVQRVKGSPPSAARNWCPHLCAAGQKRACLLYTSPSPRD